MKHKFLMLLTCSTCLLTQAAAAQPSATKTPAPPAPGMLRLIQAYPEHLKGYAHNQIIWKDGTHMPYDDGLLKTEDQTFDSTDLEDQLNGLVYTPGPPRDTPTYNCDPGTFRCTEFFQKMYGSSEAEVRGRLVPVNWPAKRKGRTQRIWVTPVNGVDKQLQAVANELSARPALRPYVTNIGGTFNWRPILGTNRQSPHSYGIAIDINTGPGHSEYWKWDHREDWMVDSVEENLVWRNSVPHEIVDIFERHGFIWGGKWYHYDTMHFEYRPELLPPPVSKAVKRRAPTQKNAGKPAVLRKKPK